HMLAALLATPDGTTEQVLTRFGVAVDTLRSEIDHVCEPGSQPLDAEALSTLGIDLDEVRRQGEEAFGQAGRGRTRAARGGKGPRIWGHIPFEPATKKVLELALREAINLRHDWIGTEHLLLGMLHAETGAAHQILAGHGLTLAAARTVVDEVVRG